MSGVEEVVAAIGSAVSGAAGGAGGAAATAATVGEGAGALGAVGGAAEGLGSLGSLGAIGEGAVGTGTVLAPAATPIVGAGTVLAPSALGGAASLTGGIGGLTAPEMSAIGGMSMPEGTMMSSSAIPGAIANPGMAAPGPPGFFTNLARSGFIGSTAAELSKPTSSGWDVAKGAVNDIKNTGQAYKTLREQLKQPQMPGVAPRPPAPMLVAPGFGVRR